MADRLPAEPALCAIPACTGLERLRSGDTARRRNSVRMKYDVSGARARPRNLHDSPDGIIPADRMAVRSGEGLSGPQSRSARARPSDSQQVYAGDSGHSSGVGSRTHCLVLYRHGQVVAPPVKPTVRTSSVGPDERLARPTLPATSLQHILRETADNTLFRNLADPGIRDRRPDSRCNFLFVSGSHSPDDGCSRIAN